jgi:hypothetical protein
MNISEVDAVHSFPKLSQSLARQLRSMRVGLLARGGHMRLSPGNTHSASSAFQFAILIAPPLFLARFRRPKNLVVHWALTGTEFQFLLAEYSFLRVSCVITLLNMAFVPVDCLVRGCTGSRPVLFHRHSPQIGEIVCPKLESLARERVYPLHRNEFLELQGIEYKHRSSLWNEILFAQIRI